MKQGHILASTALMFSLMKAQMSRRRFVKMGAAGMAGLGGLGGGMVGLGSALLQPGTANAANPIEIENALPGTDEWNLYGGLSNNKARDVQKDVCGFASATSVNKGGSVDLFISVANPQNIKLEVYRIGYYGNKGGCKKNPVINGVDQTSPVTLPAITQIAPVYDAATGLSSCHNWAKTCTLTIPANWVSGIYLIKLSCTQAVSTNLYASYIHLVVRDDERNSALLYQSSVTTFQAYNIWVGNYNTSSGLRGKSLYDFNSVNYDTPTQNKRAYKVSFDRPYYDGGCGDFLYWEYQMVYFLEEKGYDLSYCTNIDVHTNPEMLLTHKGFLSVGHDEYWSKEMYDHVLLARDLGLNLAFFSANSVYWQVRMEPNANGTPNRVMTCYKATGNVANGEQRTLDPVWPGGNPAAGSVPTLTTTFRDTPVNRPENQLLGVMFDGLNNFDKAFDFKIKNEALTNWVYTGKAQSTDPNVFPGGQATGVALDDNLGKIVGYEWDSNIAAFSSTKPASLEVLSHSSVTPTNPDRYSFFSDSTVYQATSGAFVFASGTIEWSYGCAYDPNVGTVQVPNGNRTNAKVQKMTQNILNRFIQASPATITLPRLNALKVKLPTDNGDWRKAGSLACALKFIKEGETIDFSGVPAAPTKKVIVSTAIPPLPLNVSLDGGPCPDGQPVQIEPDATLAASNADGVTFSGQVKMRNVKVSKFGGRQIVMNAGTQLTTNCSAVSKQ